MYVCMTVVVCMYVCACMYVCVYVCVCAEIKKFEEALHVDEAVTDKTERFLVTKKTDMDMVWQHKHTHTTHTETHTHTRTPHFRVLCVFVCAVDAELLLL